MKTGFKDLDLKISLNEGDLLVLAARPSMGKSIMALNILSNISVNEKKPVLYYNLELSKEQIINNLIISNAIVEVDKFNNRSLTVEDWNRVKYAIGKLAEASIYINDIPGISIDEICEQTREFKLKHDISFLLIDYVQLISFDKADLLSIEDEIREISRRLKVLAKELNIPILVISALCSDPDKREDHRPCITDFNNSISLVDNADVVLLLYRDSYYNKQKNSRETEIIIAKNRNGACGAAKVGWISEYLKFGNII